MIIGYIKGQELEIIQNTIVSDSIDYLTAEFNFSTNEWDGFIKWAHFKKDDIVYDVLLADDKILKSQHLNLSAGVWEVYVHGNKSGGTERITTNIVKLTVEPTGALNGEPLPEIPLEVAEQIMATIGSLDNLETTEKTNIVAAINEAVKTGRILNIEQTKTSSEDKGENEITISLADGKNFSFTFYNGSKGSKGDKGDKGDQGLQGEQGVQGIQGEKGEKGDKGDPGEDGGVFYITLTEDSEGNYTADKTFDEIKAAYAENKEIIVRALDSFFRLVGTYPEPEHIQIMFFSAMNENTHRMLVCNATEWKFESFTFVTKDSIVQEISESSLSGKIPSAKAVYTAIQAEKGIANGVATLDENVKIPVAQIPDEIARTSQIPSLNGYITETELENKGYLTDETDPTVPDWAKQTTKPTYTADEVGAESKGVAETKVSTHNTETTSHNDIRLAIQNLSEKLNALADSDDTTLDQLSEIVAYIKNNKSLIDNVTTSKVSIADIINNLTTNVSNKPLSAAQGVALKALIDDITIPSSLPANGGNADTVDGKHASDFAMSSHTHTASEVSGLEKYDNTEVWAKMGEMSNIQTETNDKLGFFIDETYRIDEKKVDKETGKGLSTNDYTTEEKNKLANLAAVATSGSYNDLSGTPTIDKTLSETSTDENVPSSKCVYNAIKAAIGSALGGSY